MEEVHDTHGGIEGMSHKYDYDGTGLLYEFPFWCVCNSNGKMNECFVFLFGIDGTVNRINLVAVLVYCHMQDVIWQRSN